MTKIGDIRRMTIKRAADRVVRLAARREWEAFKAATRDLFAAAHKAGRQIVADAAYTVMVASDGDVPHKPAKAWHRGLCAALRGLCASSGINPSLSLPEIAGLTGFSIKAIVAASERGALPPPSKRRRVGLHLCDRLPAIAVFDYAIDPPSVRYAPVKKRKPRVVSGRVPTLKERLEARRLKRERAQAKKLQKLGSGGG